MAQQETTQEVVSVAEIREDIVTTAVKFLQNPNVQRSAINQKQQFLRSKGLTEDEIQAACERAGAFSPLNTTNNQNITMPVNPNMYMMPQPQSRLTRFRDMLSSLALLSGLAYAVYMFYKRFIEPYLFIDRRKKRKTVEENIETLTEVVHKNTEELKDNITQIQAGLNKINQTDGYVINQQISDLKSEIGSLKSLLLSRKQFPSISGSAVVPPSIPAWQLTARRGGEDRRQHEDQDQDHDNDQDHHDDHHHQNDDHHQKTAEHDLLDSGSGSGSSETDVVTKNSDSSLEIIS